jgi:UDP-N-acetylmuramate dehydrogenase
MDFVHDTLVAPYTTFGIGGRARLFCVVTTEDELVVAIRRAQSEHLPVFLLGGGSNILVSDEGFSGMVIKNEIKDIAFTSVAEDGSVLVTVGAGENWDAFVEGTVCQGFQGLETLSWIPGTVGAAPVQNIGAYGTEVGQTVVSVRAFDIQVMKFVDLMNTECLFGYRDSLFKHEKGRYVIVRVTFRLKKGGVPNISYKDVVTYFNEKSIIKPTLREVRDAVIEIRSRKLPDWKTVGTAGSFFKNPTITEDAFRELSGRYPGLPGYPARPGFVKVALGWVLEKVCGAKGITRGLVGTYDKQALVIIAQRGAQARDVLALHDELARMVKDKTGIDIEREVELVG